MKKATFRTEWHGRRGGFEFSAPGPMFKSPAGSADWMAGGSCDPEAHAAYGFTEEEVVSAVTAAYLDALMNAPDGVGRDELRAAMVGAFVDALEGLGA